MYLYASRLIPIGNIVTLPPITAAGSDKEEETTFNSGKRTTRPANIKYMLFITLNILSELNV